MPELIAYLRNVFFFPVNRQFIMTSTSWYQTGIAARTMVAVICIDCSSFKINTSHFCNKLNADGSLSGLATLCTFGPVGRNSNFQV